MINEITTEETGEKLEPFVNQVLDSFEIPGLAIGIVKDSELVYAKGFGVKNIENREPVTTTSLFHLASVSKPFVATAIVQLVERGTIDLDAPLVSYLPYFKINHSGYTEITIRQALSHNSGLPDVEEDQEAWDWDKPQYDDGALERYVRSLVNDTLLFKPGEKYTYSNVAYEILGDIIAKVSGDCFENYVKENLLNPLDMNESTFLVNDVSRRLATSPHIRAPGTTVSKIYPYHRSHSPSSTLHSNILEMANWVAANLSHGAFREKRILKPHNHELMWKPHVDKSIDPPESVGLSWFIGDYKGRTRIRHGGGDIGFTTMCYLVPEESLAVVVLCNCDYCPVTKTADAVLDVMLGHELDSPPKHPILIPFSGTMAQKGLDAAIQQYHQLKKKQFDEYTFAGSDLEYLGMHLLGQDEARLEEAVAVLEFNVGEYPDSSSAHASLAKAYLVKGDKEAARSEARKSLALNPENVQARRILKKILDTD